MTEDEAKTKWCPFARVGGPMQSIAEGTSYNRWPGSDGTTEAMLGENHITLFIGSACMAFRWLPDATATLSGHTITNLTERAHSGRLGYCGLAGKP
jgi:hypothetical protein